MKNKWEYIPILEICEFERGTEPGREYYNTEGMGIPFIRVGNISAKIQEQVYTTSDNIKICNKDDILIALDGSPGVVIRGVEGAFSSGLRKIIVKNPEKILKDFIFYVLQSDFVQNVIQEHSSGVTIKHASKSLEFLQIPVPPLHIQQKIVYILDAVQSVIDIQEKIIEKTKELKKSLMADLFKYGGPSFRKGRKLKETEIGEIPEDWEVVKLGGVCERPQYGLTLSTLEEKTEIKFLRISDIQNEKVNWDLVPYCQCSIEDFNKYKIEEGDIVIARIGATTGKSFIIKSPPKAVFGSYLIRIKCTLKLIPEFLNYYLHTSLYWKQINLTKGGRLKGGINIPILQNLLLPLPSLPEQQEIADILITIDKKIEIEQKKKELYEELFKTLLNKIMNHEIDVENLKIDEEDK